MEPHAAAETATRLINNWLVTQNQWKDLRVSLDGDWSARVGHENRMKLRSSLQKHLILRGCSEASVISITDLNSTPLHDSYSISISHCPEMGGFATAPLPIHVGFDVEVNARVTREAISRISSEEELKMNLSSAELWAAKESSYKAFRVFQPKVLSEVEIYDVEHLVGDEPTLFRARLKSRQSQSGGSGALFQIKNMVLGVFKYFP